MTNLLVSSLFSHWNSEIESPVNYSGPECGLQDESRRTRMHIYHESVSLRLYRALLAHEVLASVSTDLLSSPLAGFAALGWAMIDHCWIRTFSLKMDYWLIEKCSRYRCSSCTTMKVLRPISRQVKLEQRSM